MDKVFHNYPKVLKYFTPQSYLDIGVCKGHAIPFILKQLPSLTKVEMIEANELHRLDLEKISETYKIPFHIEVLSDEIKEVTFHLDGLGADSTGPGNSYYLENTNYYIGKPSEQRITNTLDNIYDDSFTFDLIKMDTQGSELDIMLGGINTFSRAKVVICEVALTDINIGGCKKEDIFEILVKNFKFDYVSTIEGVLNYDRSKIVYENLLFIKP